MKNIKAEKINKISFIAVVVISFMAIFVYNLLTPIMSDDLLFDSSQYQTIGDIFINEYQRYMTWNGRSVLQILMTICCLIPKSIFNLLNSIVFVLLSLFVYWNINHRKNYDCFLYVLIQLCIWTFCVDFSQTILWLSGACNYLWGITIIMGFITLYRYLLKNAGKIKYLNLAAAGIFPLGILAGWGNENTSGGAILIVLLFTGMYFYQNRKIEKWMISGISGMVIGFLFLLLAPGNKERSAVMKLEETYTGLSALVSRGLKIFKAIDKYMLVYIVVICLLGAYFYYKKYRAEQFIETAVFAFAALATAGVLIMTPEPMPRAYFGANIYMMIAAVQMVQMIRQEDTLLISLKTGGIIAAAIAMIFVYIEEGANLARILREVNEREEYILEQAEAGNKDLTLPMLRPQFETRFSFMYDSDISTEEDWWINKVYCMAYGLDSITVVEREGWTEY